MLVEIDTRTLTVSRKFSLGRGSHDADGHGMAEPKPGDTSCSPTWAQPSPNGKRIWVACNKSSEVVEIDAATWTMTRRILAGPGVYNLAVTHDGSRILATNKRGQSVSVIDASSGKELARIATTRAVVHGVTVSDDDRYAFVSVKGRGSQPGDGRRHRSSRTLAKVAKTWIVGAQAERHRFWQDEAARPCRSEGGG